jgi:DNA-binding NarL/FixJ family response regulator
MRGTTTARNGTHARPVRVLTVDDQPLFRDAARAVITATPGFEAIAEVASGEDALALLDRLRPDIVLLDISLPGMDGLETSRRLTLQRPAPLVVLISADDDPVLRDSAREYGAAGFVSKQELRPGILRALWDRHGGAAAAITPPG